MVDGTAINLGLGKSYKLICQRAHVDTGRKTESGRMTNICIEQPIYKEKEASCNNVTQLDNECTKEKMVKIYINIIF